MGADPDEALRAARAAIAAACLDALPIADLGSITLHEHQRLLMSRAQRVLTAYGGCLIADDVGRGKTYVALALARMWKRRLIVVPSALRDTWQRAMTRSGVPCTVATHDELSRGSAPAEDFDVIVIDESHHFRNPGIRRYESLVTLTANATTILLSATPLQNRTRDLSAQIALFIGEAAFALDADALNTFVVRGDEAASAGLPAVEPPVWIDIGVRDERVLQAILALPEPVRPRDTGDEGALRAIGLVRAWASSRAALRARLRKRLRVSTAVEQGLADGVLPSMSEALAWSSSESAIQLGLTYILIEGVLFENSTSLTTRLTHEREALDSLSAALKQTPDPDIARVAALREIRRAAPHERILAFSEFASTVAGFHRLLRSEPQVGMLSSHEATIASGRIPREELLARFAPLSQGGASFKEHEQVTLLLTTDLLSEGLNLQDASIVVHLDLPWNPARLLQRLGRVRRPGGAASVRSMLFAPPASADVLLDIEQRLRAKASLASSISSSTADSLPLLTEATLTKAASGISADLRGTIFQALNAWRCKTAQAVGGPRHAAVAAPRVGWLACLADGTLLAAFEDDASRHPLLDAIAFATGSARDIIDDERTQIAMAVEQWRTAERLRVLSGVSATRSALRTSAIHRLEQLSRALPRQHRAELLPLITEVRTALSAFMPLGRERRLHAAIASLKTPAARPIRELLHAAQPLHRAQPLTNEVISIIMIGTKHHGASLSADPVVLRW